MRRPLLTLTVYFSLLTASAHDSIPAATMQAVYQEVRTPYKYGLVVAPADNYHKTDCPTVFREGDKWLMTYVCYDGKDGTDGRGYETWLAESDDLLHWHTLGRILALPPQPSQQSHSSRKSLPHLWDENQRGGFPALIDWTWGGSCGIAAYKGRHWMTYIGGHGTGYEAVREPLSIGLASTKGDVATARQWDTRSKPVLSLADADAQWWEKLTQYKSTVYEVNGEKGKAGRRLPPELARHRFIMFYNAGGINPANGLKAERIGIALSDDLKKWTRYDGNPVFSNEVGGIITGDAQIVRMCLPQPRQAVTSGESAEEACYVMFYFKAYDPSRQYNAFNTFAVSRDLIHWQTWEGEDLIVPSKPYDAMFAHKSYVLKHNGVVYHFYCAVNDAQQRGIAVATSVPLGRSQVRFPEPEPVGKRHVTTLNDGWQALVVGRDSMATEVSVPHNFDDYYGYRQLRHGNLHGSAVYQKTFTAQPRQGRRYFLQLEGVGTYATVTLNDTRYPRELVGRTVFTLDVTPALHAGTNTLRVDVDHPAMQTESPWVCGGCSSEWGFSEGSQPFGIFRPVSLIETDEVRIEPFGVHIWNNAACDSVFMETEVKNYGSTPASFELVSKFAAKSGKTVFRLSESMRLAPGEKRLVRQSAAVAGAHRWSLDDPCLYTLTSMLKRPASPGATSTPAPTGPPSPQQALVTFDDVRTPFGIRSISWPAVRAAALSAGASPGATAAPPLPADNRFYLNGKPLFINGTCEYEHLLGSSHAFTPEQIRSRVKQIANAGFNAFREAHQPHNLLYQQLFDEQGMLFWSQFSAHIWYDTPAFRHHFKRLLERWVKERRNSPSVILWGLQNESILPRDFAQECSDIIRQLDPTCRDQRLITTCNGGEGTDWNVVQNWSGTYGGSASDYDSELKRPDQLLNGEYGAWRTVGLHGMGKYSEESFTALLALKDSLAHAAFGTAAADDTSKGVCGHFQWLFASHDNPGRTQPDGAYRRIDRVGPVNYKGLTTIWEEPTPAYYMYRQRHASSPTASQFPSPAASQSPSPAASQSPSPTASQSPSPTAGQSPSPTAGLVKGEEGYRYLFRINCGGDAFVDEFGQQWQADDTIISHSWGQDFGLHPYQASQRHISESIRGTGSDALFQFFRFGRHRLWYELNLPQAPAATAYRIELYFAEPWHGRNGGERDDYEGLRIFDVAVNDSTVIDDLDPWAEAGYCGALKRVVTAKAKDGKLRISFPEVKAGQAVIAAIAVAADTRCCPPARRSVQPPSAFSSAAVTAVPASLAWHALDTDTIARLTPAMLPQDDEQRPATVCEGSRVGETTTFIISPGLGQEYALRFRYKNTSGSAVKGRLTLTDSKNTVLADRTITFPPTTAKYKMLSTTTGTQINAGTYRLTIEAAGVDFQHLEMQ